MRKILLVLFIIVISPSLVNAQLLNFPVAANGWEAPTEAKLTGPVRVILTTMQRGDMVFGTVTQFYDSSGRRIAELYQTAGVERVHSGQMVRLGQKSIYTYDANGRLERVTDYTLEGLVSRYYTFGYDASGRLVKNTAFEDGKITRQTLYIHSLEKREMEIKNTFYQDGRAMPAEKTVLTYNEKNQWQKRTTHKADGSLNDMITYEYDVKGNLIKETHCCTYNYIDRYEYKYDQRGNWIERQNIYLQDKDGKEVADPDWMYTYRVISYYDEKGKTDSPE